ncbi:MAG: hypothetical protein J6C81_07960 [Muribaculaceae bacterium]|nr:hypothetical protein [Muribaculaceae bacterium]
MIILSDSDPLRPRDIIIHIHAEIHAERHTVPTTALHLPRRALYHPHPRLRHRHARHLHLRRKHFLKPATHTIAQLLQPIRRHPERAPRPRQRIPVSVHHLTPIHNLIPYRFLPIHTIVFFIAFSDSFK